MATAGASAAKLILKTPLNFTPPDNHGLCGQNVKATAARMHPKAAM